ncbi:MAG TPA: type VI secretion system-associated protein TagF [Ramlibacter sp.]|nr:type VI secretion system-associated protein TagF [Ramlibacter sp.]
MKRPVDRVCWWGKLPTRGDFAGRGLPAGWRSDWDGWLQRGLALAAATLEGEVLRERLGAFAPWRYVALTASGEVWCGIFVASHDRVGRAFPLTLVERVGDVGSTLQAARLASLLDAAAAGPDALEAAIAAMPPRSGETRISSEALPTPPASLWWPLTAAHDAPPRVAAWPPEPQLLLDLLAPQPAAHQIASAE